MMQNMVCTSIGYDQLNRQPGENVPCPNCKTDLVILKKRVGLLYLIPYNVLEEHLEGVDVEETDCGYLAAICPECGFNITTEEKNPPSVDTHEKRSE